MARGRGVFRYQRSRGRVLVVLPAVPSSQQPTDLSHL
jgi:hypothetical protein